MTTTSPPMRRSVADAALLLAAFIWGAAFVGQSRAMAYVGAFTFSGARFALAALVILPLVVREARAAPPIAPKHLAAMGGAGLVFFLGVVTQQAGLVSTTVTNASFLTALYVVLVPALGFVVTRRAPHVTIWPAAALSLTGSLLLGGGSLDGWQPGDTLVVVSAFFWAVQILALGRLGRVLARPLTIAFVQYAVTAALGLALGFAFESPSLAALLSVSGELAYTGIVSGGIAFTLQAVAQSHAPTADAAILLSTESLFAAGFGALMLGERLTPSGWIGAGCVLMAVLIVQIGPILAARRALGGPGR